MIRIISTCSFGILLSFSGSYAFAQTPAPTDSARSKRHMYTEEMPVFPVLVPGDSAVPSNQRFVRFLNADVHFPPQALRDGISGRVLFSFAVNAQGRVQDIKIAKGLRADVDTAVLRNAHRLDAIQWEPGTQNGRPVTVSFTVPISFNINGKRPGQPLGDSLDTGPYQRQVMFALSSWNSKRFQAPKGKGMIYGSCLQRLGGKSSLSVAEYVRLVNLTTHKSVSFSVKPTMKSRRENAFFYALPAGRYALHLYVYPDKIWGPYRMYFENMRKPVAPSPTEPLHYTRYQFTVENGRVHYVGTWNLANENQPEFLDEKFQIDPTIQAYFPQFNFKEAVISLPN